MAGASPPHAAPDAAPPPSPDRAEGNVPVRPGDLIAGKYEVEQVIGAGGVGVVVSARHTGLGERVAIKLLQRSACTSDENLSRFDREGRALAKIKSAHVARVMDVGSLPSGEPFLVMELLEGRDLGVVLREDRRVAIETAVDWIVQASEAVVEAHALGIVHRDLKPANLFLSRGTDGADVLKVLDFGISKLLRDATARDQAVTQTLSVVGSPLYMSPEQMETPKDADERTDIWSLGTILYELVAGAPPFEAATMPLLCARICTADPTPLRDRAPEVPPELEAVVLRCLAKKREERFASVADLAFALAPFGPPSASYAAERIARVARQAKLPVTETPPNGLASGVRARSELVASPGDVAIVDEESSDVPKSSRRRWSWSSAPPPPLGTPLGVAPAGVASVPPPSLGATLRGLVGPAAVASLLALGALGALRVAGVGGEPPLSLSRGARLVAREAQATQRVAIAASAVHVSAPTPPPDAAPAPTVAPKAETKALAPRPRAPVQPVDVLSER